MRKSSSVPLTLLATAAIAMPSGCDNRPREIRNCVDAQNHIVSDDRCDRPSSYVGGGGAGHYIYGGSSGGRVGDTVFGGAETPRAGAVIVSGESGVVRGGFGGEGEGGGRGEGGGHGGGE